MAKRGITDSLFSVLRHFKERIDYFPTVYKVTDETYNIAFLYDCVFSLNIFLTSGWTVSDRMQPNEYEKFFGQREASIIYEVIKGISELSLEKRGGAVLKFWDVDCEAGLHNLMDNFRRVHFIYPQDPIAYSLQAEMTKVLSYFTSLIRKPLHNMLSRTEMNMNTVFEIVTSINFKVFEGENYPNGNNHLLQNLRPEGLNFYTIKQTISNLYNREKNL
jgi:hypothetical protein